MSRLQLRLEFLRIYRVLGYQTVEVPPGDAGLLSGHRDIATGLRQESGDGFLLEYGDHPLLGLHEALLGGDPDRARLLEIEGQERDLDLLARGEDHGPLDDVLQFAQVAGPGIAPQHVEGVLGEAI